MLGVDVRCEVYVCRCDSSTDLLPFALLDTVADAFHHCVRACVRVCVSACVCVRACEACTVLDGRRAAPRVSRIHVLAHLRVEEALRQLSVCVKGGWVWVGACARTHA